MRAGFYGSYDPTTSRCPTCSASRSALFVIGAYLLRRHASLLIEQ